MSFSAVELLNERKWLNNDQDVLNMLFKDSIYQLDQKWNYTTNIEYACTSGLYHLKELMKSAFRSEYGIIHYTSGKKPWNSDVPLGEHYHKYENELEDKLS